MVKQKLRTVRRLYGNASGFSAIEVLIVLAVVVVLGGIGGFVWMHRSKNTTTYKNAEFGFQFDYPKDWGTPKSTSFDGKVGKLYQLNWAGKARAQFDTKGYQYNNSGTGTIHAQISLTCKNKASKYVEWLYYDGPGCASAAIWALPNKTMTESELVVTKKFSADSKLESIVFAFGVKENSKAITDASDFKTIYTPAERQAAIDLAKSVK